MKYLIVLPITVGIGFGAFWLGQKSVDVGPKTAIETDEDGTFTITELGGRSKSMEYVTDYDSDETMDRWSLTSWENHAEKPTMTLAITDRNGDGRDDGYAVLVEYGNVGFGAALAKPPEGNKSPAGFSSWYQDEDNEIGSRYYDFNLDGTFDRLEESGASRVLVDGCWRDVLEFSGPYEAVVEVDGARQQYVFDEGEWRTAEGRFTGSVDR